jgi:hypothetical protein
VDLEHLEHRKVLISGLQWIWRIAASRGADQSIWSVRSVKRCCGVASEDQERQGASQGSLDGQTELQHNADTPVKVVSHDF